MTVTAPGNPHARHSDPATSKAAGRGSFTNLKARCVLLLTLAERTGQPLTAAAVERLCDRSDIQEVFGRERPLGVSPWRRITDCVEEGWAEVTEHTVLETNGKHQQTYRVTPAGLTMARHVRDAIRVSP